MAWASSFHMTLIIYSHLSYEAEKRGRAGSCAYTPPLRRGPKRSAELPARATRHPTPPAAVPPSPQPSREHTDPPPAQSVTSQRCPGPGLDDLRREGEPREVGAKVQPMGGRSSEIGGSGCRVGRAFQPLGERSRALGERFRRLERPPSRVGTWRPEIGETLRTFGGKPRAPGEILGRIGETVP